MIKKSINIKWEEKVMIHQLYEAQKTSRPNTHFQRIFLACKIV